MNLRFFVFVNGRNCESSAMSCLMSILTQSYRNFVCWFVDDASTDSTKEKVMKFVKVNSRFNYVSTKKHVGHLVCLLKAIEKAKPNDVMVEIDADDKLMNNGVLQRVKQEYDKGAQVTYGSFVTHEGKVPRQGPYPPNIVRTNSFRDYYWLGSHLKTYRVSLFLRIKSSDLKVDGEYVTQAEDRIVMLPMLEMAGTKAHHIPEILYIYTDRTLGKLTYKEQELVEKIHHKPRYQPLSAIRAPEAGKTSVLISVPCPPYGDITGGLTDWLVRVLAGGWPGLVLKYDRVENKWPMVRNQQLKRFLDLSNSEFLFMVDSDIVPHPQALEMVKHGVDFCSAVCFSFQFKEPFAVVMKKDPKGRDGYIQAVPEGPPGLYERDATGLACTVISRRLAKEFEGTFRDKFDDEGNLKRDADFDFCERIKAKGYKVHVDTRFVCGHKKGLDLKEVNDLLMRQRIVK